MIDPTCQHAAVFARYSHDGRFVLTAGYTPQAGDPGAMLWDAETGRLVSTLGRPGDFIDGGAFCLQQSLRVVLLGD